MRIGITTFQRAHNFGAQMQMFALYSLLKKLGNDVWILDYHCPSVEDNYNETNLFRNYSKFLSKRIYPGMVLLWKRIEKNPCTLVI